MHGLLARVSIHTWLDGAHASVYARLQPRMAGRCAHISDPTPPSHAWLARARLHPCMARPHMCINAGPPPAMHGLRTRVSIHAWLDGTLASMRAHPPAMHGLLARVSIHAWLDSACASMRAHPHPCMACAHTYPSMHGWTAHLHRCEPTPQPCMACSRASPSMHGST